MLKALRACYVAFAATLPLLAAAQVDPNRVVATVNGEDIKGGEYYRRMEFLPGVGRFIGNRFNEFPPGFMTLDTLITERLVMQLAKSKGILPSDAEVDAEFRARTEENPRLLQDALEYGLTKEELMSQIKLEVAQFKIVTYGITITDQEVDDHYKTNPSRFTIPKRLKARVIAVATEVEKAAVNTDLAAKKPFADVAKERSKDVTQKIGGDLGLVPAYAFPEVAQAPLAACKIGATTPWIKQGEAWTIYYLEDVKPEEKIPLTPALRRSIRRELMLVKGGVKNDLRAEMREIRKLAKIDIKSPEFADAYKKFIDAYLKDGG